MANHNLPTLASTYANFVTEVNGRLSDLAQGLDPAVTSVTNPPVNSIRWTSAANRWEKWNGSAWVALSTGYAINLAGPSTVTANSASAALTITQTGSGNALVVEDQAGDSTPFVITGDGRTIIGWTASLPGAGNIGHFGQLHGTTEGSSTYGVFGWGTYSRVSWHRSAGATPGVHGLVAANSTLARLEFCGSDGSAFLRSALIDALADGVPEAGTVPGRLSFATTAQGGTNPVERMRIDSAGRVGVGTASLAGYQFRVSATAAINAGAIATSSIVPAGGTLGSGFRAEIGVDAGAAVTELNQFIARQGTFSGPVANQYGFNAISGLTGATNNYGFYGNIAAAAGRWNFYAAGTAPNYFAGDVRSNSVLAEAAVPTNTNASATIAASALRNHLLTGTPDAAITYTLPTGASVEAAFTSLENNMSFEWSVINLAAVTHTITLAANTGHTVVGATVVQPATSGRFLTRKTAADTFITYRIA